VSALGSVDRKSADKHISNLALARNLSMDLEAGMATAVKAHLGPKQKPNQEMASPRSRSETRRIVYQPAS
jgi:hypothetical protein